MDLDTRYPMKEGPEYSGIPENRGQREGVRLLPLQEAPVSVWRTATDLGPSQKQIPGAVE